MKRNFYLGLIAMVWLASSAVQSMAEDVKYFDDKGITYRETRQVVQRSIPQTKMEPREYTYYRERYTTDLQEMPRTYQVPITEYQWEQRWEYSWNPFAQPQLSYRLVPKTRWETKTETVKVPVARREVVPEKITHMVPVTTQRIAEEQVVTRVAVGHSNNTTPIAGATPGSTDPFAPATGGWVAAPGSTPSAGPAGYGGVSRLDPNTPKQNPDWDKGDSLQRR